MMQKKNYQIHLTGMGINDFISYMIGFGSSTDTDYNIDYDYSSQYY